MSHAPLDRVFRLTPRDQQSTQWGPAYRRATVSDTAASITITGTNAILPPVDYNLHTNLIQLTADPGAGQLCSQFAVGIFDRGGNELVTIYNEITGTGANVTAYATIEAELTLVGGEHYLGGIAAFDAGVAANAFTINVMGLWMPRGNVALF